MTSLCYCKNTPRPILPVLNTARIVPVQTILWASHVILPNPHPSIHNMSNDVHMLLEHEKVVGPRCVIRSTDIREMFDGERRRH